MTSLRLGYKASAEQFGPTELLDFSVHAEEAGFDSVVVSDHYQPWRHTGGHAPFSFAWLGALGAKTRRIEMGTSVVTPTFRYHPSIVAQAMGTLGAPVPGPRHARHRYRRVAQRSPADGHRVAGVSRTLGATCANRSR